MLYSVSVESYDGNGYNVPITDAQREAIQAFAATQEAHPDFAMLGTPKYPDGSSITYRALPAAQQCKAALQVMLDALDKVPGQRLRAGFVKIDG